MLSTRTRLGAIVVGFSLGIAACGGGGDDGASKADFAKQANAVCADLEKSLAGLSQSEPENADELVSTVDKLQSEVDGGVTRLQEIEQPSGQAGEDAKAFVDALSKQVDEEIQPAFADMKKAAQEEDQQLLGKAVEQLQGVDSNKTNELAEKAGADGCAG